MKIVLWKVKNSIHFLFIHLKNFQYEVQTLINGTYDFSIMSIPQCKIIAVYIPKCKIVVLSLMLFPKRLRWNERFSDYFLLHIFLCPICKLPFIDPLFHFGIEPLYVLYSLVICHNQFSDYVNTWNFLSSQLNGI